METFQGPLLVLGRWVGIPWRLHRLTVQVLAQIKQYSEACSATA